MRQGITKVTAALLLGALATLSAAAQTVLDEWATVRAPAAPQLASLTVDTRTTALVVMDFNRRTCVAAQRARCVPAVPKVQELIRQARAKGMRVIFTHGPNMAREDFVPEIAPGAADSVYRAPGNKFYGTTLEPDLRAAGINTVVLTGTAAMGAVFATATGAVERGFTVVVPADTMPADTAYEEQFAIWYLANGNIFRGKATITRSDMISF
jgi:nicotinamidase-related amidase